MIIDRQIIPYILFPELRELASKNLENLQLDCQNSLSKILNMDIDKAFCERFLENNIYPSFEKYFPGYRCYKRITEL